MTEKSKAWFIRIVLAWAMIEGVLSHLRWWRRAGSSAKLEFSCRTDIGWQNFNVTLWPGDTADVSDENGLVIRILRK